MSNHDHFVTISYFTASATSAGVAWLPILNEWMQLAASFVAVVAGLASLHAWYKGRKGSGSGRRPGTK